NDSQTDRELFVLPLSSHEELGPDLAVPPEHFVCLLAWDASAVTVDDISNLAVQLLKAGAAYFVCWGPDCERVHDIIDEIA
ncbi:MAG: hypothetical protein KDD66_13860, partial [Bdellovibrionales bacterium]|nr:hypothetical protein [Bdellovibrionales bacterium]